MSVTAPPSVAVIVVAAGEGTRLDAGAPKAFVGIDDQPILHHAVRPLAELDAQLVVVAPPGREGQARTIAEHAAPAAGDQLHVVTGGSTRGASVAAGLAVLWPSIDYVLVHDAARAFTPIEVFARVLAALESGRDAVVPVLPVVDTLARVVGETVTGDVDRAELARAQTPQGIRRDILQAAYAAATGEFTDDVSLVRTAGHQVFSVAGSERSFKITTPADLERARALASAEDPVPAVATMPGHRGTVPRVGVGTDVHAFGGEGTLWLAGLEWPGEAALSGHSDGDAVAHAIVDAVLAAAGLGDIGTLFGTADPAYEGAHADVFLSRVRGLVGGAGFEIGNVSVQVQARTPRFSPRRAEAEAVLSAALGAPVSVSATTTDGLGFTGTGDGVFAIATALVVPR